MEGLCHGVAFSGPDPEAEPPRFEMRCVLRTEQCVMEYDALMNEFVYVTVEQMRSGENVQAEMCAPHDQHPNEKPRLLLDEVLSELDGETDGFEAHVMLEGMDMPVADT